MNVDEHTLNLGRLLAHLQTLELMLRVFNSGLPNAKPPGVPYGTDIYSFPVGYELPENDITNYDSLSVLLSKFNSEMELRGKPKIDMNLVNLRDALAHGRVSAPTIGENLRLIKFDKPKDNKVRITFNEVMTAKWFSHQIGSVNAAIQQVNLLMQPA